MKRVAVWGTGSIGMRHLSVLKQMSNIQPVAIPKRTGRFKELEEAGFLVALDIQSAVRMGASACIIATDTSRHVEDGLKVLESGLDLLVEKPMSTDADSAMRLYNVAKEKKKKLFVGCNLRCCESLLGFRKMLKQVGPIHSVRMECQSYLPDWRPDRPYLQSYSARAKEGGVLLDLIHEIDYAGWLFGWPKYLKADIRNLGILNIESEETAEIQWENNDGGLLSIHLDYLSRPSRRMIKVYGKEGTLTWDGIKGIVLLELAGLSPKEFSYPQTRNEMFLKQAESFLNICEESDLKYPIATGEEGIKALAVCDAIRLASQSRKEEKVAYLT